MVRTLGPVLAAALLLGCWPSATGAQTPLRLEDVIARAKTASPRARATEAAAREAGSRVIQARAGQLPRAELSHGWQRGNQPVFVFGSTLLQRRFTAGGFALDALNHPDPLTNVRTALVVTQPIYDGGLTRGSIRASELARDVAELASEQASRDLALAAVHAFGRVARWDAAHRAATGALEAAESDLTRARDRRDAGLATDADVLAVEVHASAIRHRLAEADGERRVARGELNASLGQPLDDPIDVVLPPVTSEPQSAVPQPTDRLEEMALRTRADTRIADVQASLASTAVNLARATFLPRVDAMAGWEANGTRATNGASSWMGGIEVTLNLFKGFGDRAKLAEAEEARRRQRAEREAQETAARLDVRAATVRLESARARQRTGAQAVSHAREAQRIVRDRYEQGLATVTDVLRAAEALLDAESRAASAHVDVVVQTVALDHALGRL